MMATLFAAFVAVLGATKTAQPPSSIAAGGVLAVYAGPDAAFELSIERCSGSKWGMFGGQRRCPFRVRLLRAGKAVDVVRLPQRSCGSASSVPLDPGFGADREAKAWMTGFDRCVVGVAARLVEVAPGKAALLVTQRAGFEHTNRSHQLLLPRKGKLKTIWSGDEGGRPSLATTTVLTTAETPHRQDIALIETFMPEEVESVTAKRLHFDDTTGEMVESPLPDAKSPLFLLHVGPFKSMEEAEKVWRAGHRCFDRYGFMNAALLPGLPLRGQLLGIVFARREDAQAAIVDPVACPGSPRPSVLEYPTNKQGGVDGGHPEPH